MRATDLGRLSTAFALTLAAACAPPSPVLEPVSLPANLEAMDAPVARQYRTAFERLERARATATLQPRSLGEAYGRIGMLFHAYQEWDRAVPAYRNAEALDPAAFRWPYYRALVEQKRGDLGAAASAVARAQEIDPGYFAARLVAAEIELERGAIDVAEGAFVELLEGDPGLVAAWVGRAKIALARRSPDLALGYLREALAREPERTEILYLIGQAYAARGDRETAKRYLAAVPRRNIMREPLQAGDTLRAELSGLAIGSRSHTREGVLAAVRESYELALVEFEQALRVAPGLTTALFGKALVFYQQKDHARARRQLEALLAEHPDHVNGLELLGSLELAEGNLEAAERLLRRALELDPLAERSHYELGELLRRTHRPADALDHYERALQTAPAMAEAHFGRCVSLLALGREEEAGAALARSRRALPASRALALLEARWLAASPLARERDSAAALGALRQLATAGVELSLAESVAMAHAAAGDFAAAGRWQRAVLDALASSAVGAPWVAERLHRYRSGRAAPTPWLGEERILPQSMEPPEPI
jgi:tetratricopeptide (TPR) repeat protein